MLRELHIKNVAVIEEITVDFFSGFHVLTGETGAGKSILIDSIHMGLGGRTSKDLIRTGAESATVDLCFEVNSAAAKGIEELGVDTEDGMLYISRKLDTDGKSKCRINGRMVPLSQLKEAAAYLLTIHGQNDNQSLLDPKTHLQFVDRFGKNTDLLARYRAQYQKVLDCEKRLDSLVTDEKEKAYRVDLLRFQIQEITAANLTDGEEEELLQRQEYLSHFEQIAQSGSGAYEALYGAESAAAYDQVSYALHQLEDVRRLDETLEGYYQTLHSVLADLEDVTHELKSYMEQVEFDPSELEQIGDRLQLIAGLKRKYGGTTADLLAYLEKAEEELSGIENSDALRETLTKELEKEKAVLGDLAKELTLRRTETAKDLQIKIMEELYDLDMQKMRFSVGIEPIQKDGAPHFTADGCDRVEFFISGNPGEPLKPLAKIASGGEMSRIMLAIKSVFADGDVVETLIFDEIDTGVSGRAAQKIAEKLCMLAKHHQILCITHLAQIAGMADVHYLIEKHSDQESTATSVRQLDETERKAELARIIGGVKVTDLTMQAAQEMLNLAAAVKERR